MRSIESIVYLTKFTLDRCSVITEEHQTKSWMMIREGYNSDDFTTQLISCLMNGLLTTSRIYFLLSKNEILNQMAACPYLRKKRKSLSGSEFEKLKAILIKSKFIKIHLDSSSFESNERRAARVELIAEPFRTEIRLSLSDDEFTHHREAFLQMVHSAE